MKRKYGKHISDSSSVSFVANQSNKNIKKQETDRTKTKDISGKKRNTNEQSSSDDEAVSMDASKQLFQDQFDDILILQQCFDYGQFISVHMKEKIILLSIMSVFTQLLNNTKKNEFIIQEEEVLQCVTQLNVFLRPLIDSTIVIPTNQHISLHLLAILNIYENIQRNIIQDSSCQTGSSSFLSLFISNNGIETTVNGFLMLLSLYQQHEEYYIGNDVSLCLNIYTYILENIWIYCKSKDNTHKLSTSFLTTFLTTISKLLKPSIQCDIVLLLDLSRILLNITHYIPFTIHICLYTPIYTYITIHTILLLQKYLTSISNESAENDTESINNHDLFVLSLSTIFNALQLQKYITKQVEGLARDVDPMSHDSAIYMYIPLFMYEGYRRVIDTQLYISFSFSSDDICTQSISTLYEEMRVLNPLLLSNVESNIQPLYTLYEYYIEEQSHHNQPIPEDAVVSGYIDIYGDSAPSGYIDDDNDDYGYYNIMSINDDIPAVLSNSSNVVVTTESSEISSDININNKYKYKYNMSLNKNKNEELSNDSNNRGISAIIKQDTSDSHGNVSVSSTSSTVYIPPSFPPSPIEDREEIRSIYKKKRNRRNMSNVTTINNTVDNNNNNNDNNNNNQLSGTLSTTPYIDDSRGNSKISTTTSPSSYNKYTNSLHSLKQEIFSPTKYISPSKMNKKKCYYNNKKLSIDSNDDFY
ncbi:hypothetical protein WA158_002816 [Blastocystis sp. Blastoise]